MIRDYILGRAALGLELAKKANLSSSSHMKLKNNRGLRDKRLFQGAVLGFLFLLVGLFWLAQIRAKKPTDAESCAENLTASKELPRNRSTRPNSNFPDEEDVSKQGAPEKVHAGVNALSLIKRGKHHRLIFPQSKKMATIADREFPGSLFKLQKQELGPLSMNQYSQSAIEVTLNRDTLKAFLASGASLVHIPLDEDRMAQLKIDYVVTRGEHTYTLVGQVNDEPGSQVVLVFHDRVVSGSVAFYHSNEHYDFGNAGNGNTAIRLLDTGAFIERCGNPDGAAPENNRHNHDKTTAELVEDGNALPELSSPGEGRQQEMAEEGIMSLDTVVGYGLQARIAEGGVASMEAKIIASVDRMNAAFGNSQIAGMSVELRATMEDPDYVYPGRTSGSMAGADELGDLENESDGNLDALSNLRIALGADTNCLVIKDADGSAGIAYVPGRSMIVARTYMASTRITYAHEFGHNIGCQHAWGDNDSSSTTKHNYGWRFDPPSGDKVRTIMAYDWGWTRIPYYSNPNVQYNGANTGAVDGYDATGDATADPRAVTGGLDSTTGNISGYDGTHLSLGARNADFISNQAQFTADNAERPTTDIWVNDSESNQLTDQVSKIYFSGSSIGSAEQHTFTIINTGAEDMTGLSVNIDGAGAGVFIVGDLSSETLQFGERATFSVTYTAQSLSESDAAIHIVRDNDLGNSFDFDINGVVQVLLFSEGFEADPGDWVNSTNYDFNWLTNSGSTPSNTGPSAASEGSRYIYVEASTPNYPNKTGAFEFTYDLMSLLNTELKFDYHMYGQEMGSLFVDVYDGVWHQAVWSATGQKHFSSGESWDEAAVDLSAYQDQSGVKIRFRGVTASSWSSDMAVDNVRLFGITVHDLSYVAGNGGSLAGLTNQVVTEGASGSAVEAVPSHYYHFVDWSDGFTQNPRTDTEVSANISVTANFAADNLTDWAVSAGLSGDDALPTAMPWNDGVKNIFKFAFNMDGTSNDSKTLTSSTGLSGLPVLTRDDTGPSPVYKYEYLRLRSGVLSYTPVKTDTMAPGSWITFSPTVTITEINAVWERVVIDLPDDGAPNSRWFYGIQVEESP